jgi:hypothetical protein
LLQRERSDREANVGLPKHDLNDVGAMTARTLISLAPFVLATAVSAQQTGTVSGYVTDRDTGRRVSDVLVSVRGSTLQGVTDAEGLFRIAAVPIGPRVLVVQHVAYGEHTDSVVVAQGAETRVQIVISREAISLAPLTVEAASDAERNRRAAGTSINQILRPEIEEAGRRGLDLGELLQQSMPGVRVTPINPRGALTEHSGAYCVEYRSAEARRGSAACREVTVYVDDIAVSSPSSLFSTLALQDIERLEMLAPGEAGTRYGIASRGVLLIETRSGARLNRERTRDARPARQRVNGFDWTGETRPYPWTRVLGSSFLGNAVGVGAGLLVASKCFTVNETNSPLRSRCDAFSTIGSTFVVIALPTVAGTLATRWTGTTERSEGRFDISLVLGTLTVTSGYLILFKGESGGSSAGRAVGIAVLSLVTPAVTALSNRVFRVLR